MSEAIGQAADSCEQTEPPARVFGPVGPAPGGVDTPYWEGLRVGELRIQRCPACAEWIWGPQWICGRCHRFDPGWVSIRLLGTVYSWATTWHPFVPEMAGEVPVTTVVVELPLAGRRRAVGQLADPGDVLAVGAPLHGRIEPVADSSWPIVRWYLDSRQRGSGS